MSRKMIVIDLSKSPYFRNWFRRLAYRLDFEGKISMNHFQVFGFKGNISKAIKAALEGENVAYKELYETDKDWVPEDDIQVQIDYLKGLIA